MYSIGYLDHSALPPFLLGVEPTTKFSKRRGLTGSQFLVGVSGKERGHFFRGV